MLSLGAMAKPANKSELLRAADNVAGAIRYHADKKKRRRRGFRGVADKFMALGNIIFGGLILSQAFSEHFDTVIAVVGLFSFIAAYAVAIFLYAREGGERR